MSEEKWMRFGSGATVRNLIQMLQEIEDPDVPILMDDPGYDLDELGGTGLSIVEINRQVQYDEGGQYLPDGQLRHEHFVMLTPFVPY